MSDPKEFDPKTLFKETHAFLQWKGTDVCMDFHCECGVHIHINDYFVYAVRCSNCKVVWEMPFNLFPRRAPIGYDGIIYEDREGE